MGSQFRTNFAGDFKKMQKSARRAAGREIGSAVVRQRIEALVDNNHTRIGGGVRRNSKNNSHRNSLNSGGAISSRRKKAVRSIVGADGTLVVLDLFPHAEQLETGKTITSSKKMFIGDGRRWPQVGEQIFFVKRGSIDLVLASKGKPKAGAARRPPRLVGVMTSKIKIRQIKNSGRLRNIAACYLDQYLDAVDKHLWRK